MPELVYSIVAEAEGFARGMDKAQQKALGFDTSMEALVKTGIQTTEMYRDQIVQLDLLHKKYGEDALVAGQLAEQKKRLVREMERYAPAAMGAGVATDRIGRASKMSHQNLVQFGYAVSDMASVTGGMDQVIRAASNNIQMMGLTLSGPAFLAITGATVAAMVFADEIGKAFEVKGVTSVDAYKGALSSLIDIQIEAFDTRFAIKNLAHLDAAIGLVKGRMAELSEEGAMSGVELWVTKNITLPLAKLPGLKAFNDFFAGQGKTIDELTAAVQLGNRSAGLQAFEKELEATRERIELYKELFDLFKGNLPLVTPKKHGRSIAEEIDLQIGEEFRGFTSFEELKRIRDAVADQRMKEWQELEKRAFELPKEADPLTGAQLPDVEGAGILKGFSESQLSELREMGAAIEQDGKMVVSKAAAVKGELTGVMADFGPAIAGGLANAALDVALGRAKFGEAFGGFLTDLGQGLIASGAAGIALKVFISNPYLAIAAGAGLVAIGSALAASSQQKANSFASRTPGMGGSGGGGSAHFGGPGYRSDRSPFPPPQRDASNRVIAELSTELKALRQVVDNVQRQGIPAHFDRGELKRGQASLAYRSELTSVRGDG